MIRKTDGTCVFVDSGEDADGPIFHCINTRYSNAYFTDDGCSEPIIGLRDDECEPAESGKIYYAFRPESGGCQSKRYLYRAGDVVDPSTGLYGFDYATGECVPTTIGLDEILYEALEPDLENYVEGRQSVEELDAGLGFSVLRMEGADGSSFLDTYALEEEECHVSWTESVDQAYCIVGDVFPHARDTYGDAACQEEASVYFKSYREECGEVPQEFVFREGTEDGCFAPQALHRFGEKLDVAYSTDSSETCEETEPPEGVEFWTLGPEVTEGEVPTLTLEEVGDGRLRLLRLSHEGMLLDGLSHWYDTALDMPCAIREVVEGEYRCLPAEEDLYSDLRFSDPDCTDVVYYNPEGDCFHNYPLKFASHFQRGECGKNLYSVELLEEYEGKVYWELSGECQEITEDLREQYYQGTGVVSPEQFAEMRVTRD